MWKLWSRSLLWVRDLCNQDTCEFSNTNLTFPDLSPAASACPSGLIRRHLTPALRVSLLESRMFFMACEKKKKTKITYAYKKSEIWNLIEDFQERESSEEKRQLHLWIRFKSMRFRSMRSKLFPFECAMRHAETLGLVTFLLCLRPHVSSSCS